MLHSDVIETEGHVEFQSEVDVEWAQAKVDE